MSGRPNPYVGPRAFVTGEPLYGRDRERAALLDLLIAERVVLLHAPSGAGKSSLLQAGLVPDLIAEGFVVRPTIRVGMEPPAGAQAGANRYVTSALLSLEGGLARVGLDLQAGLGEPEESEVLIFDQFEEVLTADPNNREAKHAFFAALGAALRSPRRWAVFSMREDYVASLAPYVRAVPTRLKATFQLDLLGVEGATQAARRPAEAAGVTFSDEAARRLIDDLRQVKVQAADGAATIELGPFVEPVQLQVVCRNLWARLPDDDTRIEADDIAAIGDVDAALTEFYDAEVAAVAGAGDVAEREVRAWFESALITEHGLRGQVLQTAERSGGLANAVIRRLIDAHLVRAEKRRGMTWFELAHDRMIAPVRASNARWTEGHLTAAQRQAELWDRTGRPESLLLRDPVQLQWATAAHGQRGGGDAADGGSPAEQAFIEQSRMLQARVAETERLRRQSLWLRRLMLAGVIVGLGIAVVVMVSRYFDEREQKEIQRGLVEKERAATQLARAAEERATDAADRALARQLAAELALLPDDRVDLAALLAVTASRLTDGPDAEAALHGLHARAPLMVAVIAGELKPRRLARSADGTQLAAIEDTTLGQWDVAARRFRVLSMRQEFSDLAFDERRRQFVTTDSDQGQVTFWRPDGREDRVLGGATTKPPSRHGLAVAPDGSHVATVDERGLVVVLDAETGTTAASRRIEGERIVIAGREALRFAPDGRSLAIAAAKSVVLWPWATGSAMSRGRGFTDDAADSPVAVRFTPDGAALVGLSGGGVVRRWPIADGGPGPASLTVQMVPDWAYVLYGEHLLGPGRTQVLGLGLADDGGSAAAITCDRWCAQVRLRVWSGGDPADTMIPLRERPEEGRRMPMVVDGEVALVGGASPAIRVLDMKPWQPFGGITDVAGWSADGTRVALVGRSEASVVDLRTRATLWRAPLGPEPAQEVAFFAGDTRVAVRVGSDGALRVLDAATGAAVAGAPTRVFGGTERMLRRGDDLLAVTRGRVRVDDVMTGRTLHAALGRETALVRVLAIDAAGRRLAADTCEASSGGRDTEIVCARSTVHVWDLETGAPVGAPRTGQLGFIRHLEFTPDGAKLLSVGEDGWMRLWDLAGGPTVEQQIDGGWVEAAAFTADGGLLATLGCVPPRCDRTESELRLFQTATLQAAAPARQLHNEWAEGREVYGPWVREIRFDGSTVYAVGRAGVVAVELGLAAMQARACRLAGRELTASEWGRYVAPARPQVPVCPQGPPGP